jgi:quinol monooxygenase YgiN
VEWDDAEAMRASLTSPEGQAVAEDMAPYVTEGTVLLNYSLQDFLLSAAAIQGDS